MTDRYTEKDMQVTASDMRIHHVLLILTLPLIRGHTNLNREHIISMFDYFRNCSSNAHHFCCEDSPTNGFIPSAQADDLDLHSIFKL